MAAQQTRTHAYRLITAADLGQVVLVHRKAFPESAISQLGAAVVERYYRWQLSGPHPDPYALGAWRGGELVGFVFGGLRYNAVAGFARGSLGTIAVGALTHPRALRRLALPKVVSLARLMVYRRPPRPTRAAAPLVAVPGHPGADPIGVETVGPSFGILSLAVLPEAQGSGVAGELMAHAVAAAVDGAFSQMHLTVQVDNPRAIAFYEKWGWERTPASGEWAGAMCLRLRHG